MDPQVTEFLSRMYAETARRHRSGGDVDEVFHIGLGAIEVLSLTGELARQDAENWVARFVAAAGRPSGLAEGGLSSSLQVEAIATDNGSDRAVAYSPSLGRLEAMITVDARLADLHAIAIELYDDAVVVRWQCPAPSDDTVPIGSSTNGLVVRDDRGDTYSFVAGGCFGVGRQRLRGESVFAPAIASGVRELQLVYGESSVSVPLP